MNIALTLVLMVGLCAFAYSAAIGFRGKALNVDYYGRGVPDRVKTTPHLRARANRLFVVCGVAAAISMLGPLMWLFADFQRERTTWELLGLAAYAFVVVIVGSYPFAKIKSL